MYGERDHDYGGCVLRTSYEMRGCCKQESACQEGKVVRRLCSTFSFGLHTTGTVGGGVGI